MEKRIEKMRGHYVVCGIGMVGLYIVHELYETKRPQIVIDTDPLKFDLLKMRNMDVPFLLGDATENEHLERALIREAKGLFATTNSDNDNIVIALTAKQINPNLRVVCRCNDTKNTDKIKRAGADTVVALNYIGGLRMAAEMIRPHATDFLESMLRDREHPLRVEEARVPGESPYVGKRIEELQLENMGNLLLLAIRKGEGEWIYNPAPSVVLEKDMRLIVLATPEERQLLHGALRFETVRIDTGK
jgi:voltage-gated potassium channel